MVSVWGPLPVAPHTSATLTHTHFHTHLPRIHSILTKVEEPKQLEKTSILKQRPKIKN